MKDGRGSRNAVRRETLKKLRGVPRPLAPVYRTRRPNQSIKLHEGPLQITQGKNCVEGNGTIRLEWLPFPRIGFTVTTQAASPFLSTGPAIINGPTINLCVPANIDHFRGAASTRIAGNIFHPVRHGSGNGLRRLLIHFVNFREFIGTPVRRVTPKSVTSSSDRLVLEAEGWKVTMDAVRGFEQLQEATCAQNGYAITHLASVERSDGGSFPITEADDFLGGLNYFLSFARGFWSPGILRVAYDAGGYRVWSEWAAGRATPHRAVLSWTDVHHPESLAGAFPGFMAKWTDPNWREAIRLAIHWYVEANVNAGSLEGSIVSTQVALELLSWMHFVVGQGTPEKPFDRSLSAAQKLRGLLTCLGIPTAVPPLLPNVAALPFDKPSDGPERFAFVRNSLVHPKRSEEFKEKLNKARSLSAFEVREDAWRLGLWYLEMSLLSLFGFRGVYSNRLQRGGYVGAVESVPWARP
ncbi:MAG: hypothetical protein HY699_20205 [Deltaproteobacteria bacterium]|nr:hypothetical protein [Deltaproteobacteria bacterium]